MLASATAVALPSFRNTGAIEGVALGPYSRSVDEAIVRRIERASGIEDLAGLLVRLPPTDLQSLLLEVQRRRTDGMLAKAVLNRYERGRFVRPSESRPAELLEFDRRALSLAPTAYEPIELSPVAPLGAASVLGNVSQNWAVSTIRNSEVVSDSTNVLALECAARRRHDRAASVKLICSHRLLRGQDYGTDGASHFKLLGLAAAGRGGTFAVDALSEQFAYFSRLLGDIRIAVTPLGGTLAEKVLAETALNIELDRSREAGRSYYVGVCFKIFGGEIELGDGGFVEWTQTLLGDQKERLLISGIGTERAIDYLRPKNDLNLSE